MVSSPPHNTNFTNYSLSGPSFHVTWVLEFEKSISDKAIPSDKHKTPSFHEFALVMPTDNLQLSKQSYGSMPWLPQSDDRRSSGGNVDSASYFPQEARARAILSPL